ncbi:MAG: MFS transporter [Bryobacterales bacterium]|nr:MFS transporter [Bryobacterales bacterium]
MSSKRWWVVCLLSLGMVIAYSDRVNLTIALPDMVKGIQMDKAEQGLALSAFFWTYTIFQIPAGMLVDRFGVRLLYTAGFLLWSVGSAATMFTRGLADLVTLRLLVGTGESVVTSSSLYYIRKHFQEKERGFAVGLYMTGTKLGPAVGLPMAALLIQQVGWQAMFGLLGLGSLLWLIPWLLWVRRSDPAAQGLVVAAKTDPNERTGLLDALKSPLMWGVIIGTYCYMYFVYYCMTWMPRYFQEQHGMSLQETSWFSGMSFGGMALVAAVSGWWADKLIAKGGDPVRVRKAFTIAGFVIASTQTISVYTHSETLMIFFTVASLCGLGLATANYWALTQTLLPGALPVAIQNTAANLAGVVAPWLSGWLIKQTGSFDAPIKTIGFWLVLGVAAYGFLVQRKFAPRTAMAQGGAPQAAGAVASPGAKR